MHLHHRSIPLFFMTFSLIVLFLRCDPFSAKGETKLPKDTDQLGLIPSETTIVIGNNIEFSYDSSQISGPHSYKWLFDGGLNRKADVQTTQDPSYTIRFLNTGSFNLVLSVIDSNRNPIMRDTSKIDVVSSPTNGIRPSISSLMRLIPARDSVFGMGNTDDYSRESREYNFRGKFTYDFYIDTIEITQGYYDEIMRSQYQNYSRPKWGSANESRQTSPVYLINWFDAILFCNARTKVLGGLDTVYKYDSIIGTPGDNCILKNVFYDLSKNGYRLPTEAEWEYACKAGTTSDFYWGNGYWSESSAGPGHMDWEFRCESSEDYAWYRNDDSVLAPRPVASKLPNKFGLYDMCGNVSEWVNGWKETLLCSTCTIIDPSSPNLDFWFGQPIRVQRGGSYNSKLFDVRSISRTESIASTTRSDVGFRCVLRK